MIPALFGGLAGALISLVVSFMVQQRRLRGEVAIKVVGYIEATYLTIQELTMERTMSYTHPNKYDHARYMEATRRMRELILHDTIRAQVAVVFGSGTELGLLTAIQEGFRDVAKAIWEGTQQSWHEATPAINERMTAIDVTRKTLEQRLIKLAQPPWWLRWSDGLG